MSSSLKDNTLVRGAGLIILLGALTAMDPLSIDMYLPAFLDMQKTFQTSMANIELSVSTFFVGMAVGQLIYGPLADRFGRKKPLVAGMLVYLIATLGCALAPNIRVFIGFRLMQALGGCAGMVITRAIIRDLFDKHRVAVFLSNMALVMGLAPILAPNIGAFINGLCGWKAIFYVLAAMNITVMTCIVLFLPETNLNPHPELRFSRIFKAYGGLLKNREFVGYLIPDTAIRAGMFAYIAGSAFVFIDLLHVSQRGYGLIFGMNGVALLLASQVNRRLLHRFSPERILRWSVSIAALASLGILLAALSGPVTIGMISSLLIFLATLNFVGPNSIASALATQGHQAGTASALYGCLQWSMASFSSFFVSFFHNGTALPMAGVIVFCGLISFVAYWTLVGARKLPVETN